MKLKMITAACAVMCSGGAFAAVPAVTCSSATLAGLVNTCAPEVTFYVAGASAQGGALNAVLATGAGIFNTSAVRGKIYLTSSSVSGLNSTTVTDRTKSNTVAYVGLGAAGTSYAGKRVMVIYNKANGSAAGVLQLLTGKGTAANEQVTLYTASAKSLAKGIAGACTVNTDSVSGSLGDVSCGTEVAFSAKWGGDAQKSAHMALSDVRPSELTPGIVKKWDATKFPTQTTAMQGFGVIVNPALYTALIASEVAAGRLPSSCTSSETVGGATDVITAACQPNLTRALYSSVITGQITTADALLGTSGDTKVLSLARRVDSSGTQAASNIFFAGQAGYAVKTPTDDGFVTPLAAGTSGTMVVTEGAATGDVITAVAGNTTGYAMGVVSIENFYSMTKSGSKLAGALFVKMDGISPNFKADGTLEAKHRVGLQAGYPFQFEMQALKPAALAGDYLDIHDKIVTALKDPAQNLAGIAYIGSSDATKNTAFTRGGKNYQPLVKN